MTEADARTILLVKAVEQNDPKAEILSRHLRHEASVLARSRALETEPVPASAAGAEQFFAARAQCQAGHLQYPAVHAVLAATTWRGWITPVVALVALALGLASNVLGPQNRISILAFPLLGMLVWNLAVYGLLIFERLKGHDGAKSGAHPASLIGWLQRLAFPTRTQRNLEGAPQQLARGLRAFYGEWLRVSSPLFGARMKCALHWGAALLALGSVAGMYLRGLAFEYRAGWESTFLDAAQVHQLLRFILGPASWITGLSLPGVEQLQQIRWPEHSGENAARWIHLYAATAGLFIILPRWALAGLNARRAGRLSRDFPLPLDDLYFRRLRGSDQLAGESAWILPCGLELSPRHLETIRAFLYEVLGLNAHLHFEAPIAYGNEDALIERARHQPQKALHILVLFNMAATPEAEHHGRLLAELQSLLNSPEQRLVPILDESSYRRRLSGQAESENQIEKRRKTWQRLARDHGLPLLTLDLDAPDPDYWYELLRQALAQGAPRPGPA